MDLRGRAAHAKHVNRFLAYGGFFTQTGLVTGVRKAESDRSLMLRHTVKVNYEIRTV